MDPAPVPGADLDVQRLSSQFAGLSSREEFLRLAVRLINAAGGMIFRRSGEGMEVVEELLSRQAFTWSDNIRQELAFSAHVALTDGAINCRRLETVPGVWIVSCPAPEGHERTTALSLLILIGSSPPEPFLVIVQLLASLLGAQQRVLDNLPAVTADNLGALLTLLAGALIPGDPREVLLRLNVALKGWARSFEVAIGTITASGQVELRSLANVISIDQRTDYARIIGKVMRECISRERALIWPDGHGNTEDSPVLTEASVTTRSVQILALPLNIPEKSVSGVLVLLWSDWEDRSQLVDQLNQTAPLLAVILARVLEKSSPLDMLTGSFSGGKRRAPWRMSRPAFYLLGIAALILANLLPLPFRVNADCVTLPVSSRTIVSRFDGILQEVLVQPGDQLEVGAVLARLDGRELDLQLGGLTAERDKASKMRDQYLAVGDTALAQIALLDSQRYEAQLDLIWEKKQHLTITSPIAGIVISDDLRRVEGSPVNKGQPLFEIAPLKQMEIEISVPEKDIAVVEVGLPVQIRFTAYPATRWHGSIAHIVPKSQIRGNSNVFIAKLQFDNLDGVLRPGMRGESQISAGWRLLGWQLFRKPWHTLRRLADQFF